MVEPTLVPRVRRPSNVFETELARELGHVPSNEDFLASKEQTGLLPGEQVVAPQDAALIRSAAAASASSALTAAAVFAASLSASSASSAAAASAAAAAAAAAAASASYDGKVADADADSHAGFAAVPASSSSTTASSSFCPSSPSSSFASSSCPPRPAAPASPPLSTSVDPEEAAAALCGSSATWVDRFVGDAGLEEPCTHVGLDDPIFALSLTLGGAWPPPALMRPQYEELCAAIDAIDPGAVHFRPFETLHVNAAELASGRYFVEKRDKNHRAIKALDDELARLDAHYGAADGKHAETIAEHAAMAAALEDVVDRMQGITLKYAALRAPELRVILAAVESDHTVVSQTRVDADELIDANLTRMEEPPTPTGKPKIRSIAKVGERGGETKG